jgi:serpin B
MDALQSASIKLSMPKVDIAASQILNDKLKALGLVQPFMANEADFSALANADLFISKVLHKSRLKIDEAGTEAAAVTSISIDVTSMPVFDHEMVIDRPFQVFIVDLDNNLILFSGWLNEVKSAE